MSIIQQLFINRLPLPEDMVEEIKSFCFYDKVTAKTIFLKNDISSIIMNAFSLATIGDIEGYSEPEKYLFTPNFDEDIPLHILCKCSHQIIFCPTCGNYARFSSIDEHASAIEKVRCKCPFGLEYL
uniref:Uncharacterized protein n=1 Tax=viral metagenome TaxID=1070528 RepID=A0A6C0DQ39_9ZZZZ